MLFSRALSPQVSDSLFIAAIVTETARTPAPITRVCE